MSTHREPPRTWLMLGGKAGDNTQITALAEGLGWPFETKRLAYRRTELFTNLFAGATTKGLVAERSDPLAPPWPELVISAGRRNEPLVRWIQAQAGQKNVRLVHVGRPWALHECFDLIITTPQYRLPQKPHILHNELPLQRVNGERLRRAAADWRKRLAHLPEPRVTVLMGGHAGPYNFDRENGALLGWHADRLARLKSGSLLITTSARTPETAIRALAEQLSVPHHLHRFAKDEPAAGNPFFAFLAAASEIVVTADSMSMLAEAVATGKPTHIFDLARHASSNRPARPAEAAIQPRSPSERLADFRFQAVAYEIGMRLLPSRLTRDVRIIHDRQVEAGRAVWLGQEWSKRAAPPPLTDLPRAVAAVQALFSDDPPTRPRVPQSPLPEIVQRVIQG